MKVVKILGRIVLAVFGLAALLYFIVLAVNWKDQPPSAAALRMEELIYGRPQVPASDNAAVYIHAFNVPVSSDPHEVGARRVAWIESFTASTGLDGDPLRETIDFKSGGSPAAGIINGACGKDDRKSCPQGFETAARDWQPTEMESFALQRYRSLLGHHAWRDAVPYHVSAPLPAYGPVMHAQRLYLLSMMQLAQRGDADAVREGLNADFAYWRAAQLHADLLIGKMIAVAGLRNHFFYSNLVLRQLPADQAARAMPPDWGREFSADERSMYLVMAGEWMYSQSVLSSAAESVELIASDAEEFPATTIDKWLGYLTVPMFQVQDTLNGVADNHLRCAQQFAVPMNQYAAAKLTLENHLRDHPHPISVYNPVGDYFLQMSEGATCVTYAYRVANPEGMRRAALLVAQLRARGISADAVESEVARAELREPYTNAPFEWDPKSVSVLFTGPEDQHWRRHEYFY